MSKYKYFKREHQENYDTIVNAVEENEGIVRPFEYLSESPTSNSYDEVALDYMYPHQEDSSRFFALRFFNNVKNPLSIFERRTIVGVALKGIARYLENLRG
jgi:hypothetical protein